MYIQLAVYLQQNVAYKHQKVGNRRAVRTSSRPSNKQQLHILRVSQFSFSSGDKSPASFKVNQRAGLFSALHPVPVQNSVTQSLILVIYWHIPL